MSWNFSTAPLLNPDRSLPPSHYLRIHSGSANLLIGAVSNFQCVTTVEGALRAKRGVRGSRDRQSPDWRRFKFLVVD
jgi:hypothetical protein